MANDVEGYLGLILLDKVTRLHVLIRILFVLIALMAVAAFAFWQRAKIIVMVNPQIEYCVQIDGGECRDVIGDFTKRISYGKHQLVVKRNGYLDYKEEISLDRSEELMIIPEFIFAPVLTVEKWEPIYRISAGSGDSISDNQWERLSDDCGGGMDRGDGMLLDNMPGDISEIDWHHNGKWALIKVDGWVKPLYYIYEVESGESKRLGTKVQGAVVMPGDNEIAYIWDEPDGSGGIVIADRVTGQFEEVTSLSGVTDGRIYPSPDGEKILFRNISRGNQNNFYLIDRGTGRKEKITFGNDALTAKWSPDGKWVLLVLKEEGDSWRMVLLDSQSGEKKDLPFISEISEMAWLPGGDSLIFIDRETQRLIIFDIETGDQRLLMDHVSIDDPVATCINNGELLILNKADEMTRVKFAE